MIERLKPHLRFASKYATAVDEPVTKPSISKAPTKLPSRLPSPTVSVSPIPTSISSPLTRTKVGKDSPKAAGRSDFMRSREDAIHSKGLRTPESVVSTMSQAEFSNPLQSMIIIDWDDTLCPSHWIRVNRPKLQYFQPCPNDPKYKKPLADLSGQVIRLLRAASEVGKTIILTNAQPGWVEISCKNFLPNVWGVIQELQIDVIYARQSIELDTATSTIYDYNYNANAPQLWKEKAMKDHIGKFYSRYLHQSWKNIVSIGDQLCEHNACRIVTLARPSQKRKCRTKTIKLVEEPAIDNLTAQLQVLNQWINGIVGYDGELNVDLSNGGDVIVDLHHILYK